MTSTSRTTVGVQVPKCAQAVAEPLAHPRRVEMSIREVGFERDRFGVRIPSRDVTPSIFVDQAEAEPRLRVLDLGKRIAKCHHRRVQCALNMMQAPALHPRVGVGWKRLQMSLQ